MLDYFRHLSPSSDRETILAQHQKLQRWVNQPKKGFLRYRQPFEFLSGFSAEFIDCAGDTITIGRSSEVDAEQKSAIRQQLKGFMPWRKGPFSVFGIDIDAEWRSERKWRRLQDRLPDIGGKVVADIGCNNGYYMFKMVPAAPRFVLGFEPSVQHYYCFKALNAMAGCSNLGIDLLGVEHIALFRQSFDVIFLMGVIYHRSSPMQVLEDLFSALKPGGTLVVESQAIPGTEPVSLFPEKTYAKAPGTYFIPTGTALKNWLLRTGFEDVELFCSHPMSSAEQRRTEWMIFESYQDYIDPQNPELTVEGYPAPHRVYLLARRTNKKGR
jgi:tRNA (mo5U34)-methyltransferase